MIQTFLNLHLFGDGGAGAGAAPAGPAGEGGGEAAVITPGVLEDGTQVDDRLAARLEKQAEKRRSRGEAVQLPAKKAPAEPAQPTQAEAAEPSLDEQWAEAKKKFKDQYGRDVQSAIQDRFKNQKDANDTLSKLEPALKALARQRGIDEGNLEALADDILSDDSLFEEEAEKAGMTVEGYRNYQAMMAENERMHQQEQIDAEQRMMRQHFMDLARQADAMKDRFPDLDLSKEMENETFRRLVAPNSGLSLEAAYYAVHHQEIAPQAMAYGIQRAQQQISQSIQANQRRPVEGAQRGAGQRADVAMDPKAMSREQRQQLIERARRGEKIII